MIDWLSQNKDWLGGLIGTIVIVVGWFVNRNPNPKFNNTESGNGSNNQFAGDNSTNNIIIQNSQNNDATIRFEKLTKEMEMLVASMHAKIGNPRIFMNGSVYRGSIRNCDKEYHRFWDSVKENKHLVPNYLRSSIDNYLASKSNDVSMNMTRTPAYEKAETELYDAVKKRYYELVDELDKNN